MTEQEVPPHLQEPNRDAGSRWVRWALLTIHILANLGAKPVPSNDILIITACPLKFLDFSASLPNDHDGSRRMCSI